MATRSNNRSGSGLGLAAGLCLALIACASGTGGGVGDDYEPPDNIDARVDGASPIDAPISNIDARVDAPGPPIDASMQIDAPLLPDGGLPGTCTVDTQCPAAECCFISLCVPGTRTGLPSPLNCAPA